MELDSQESPGEIKSREVELDSQEPGRDQEQGGGGGAGLSREPRRDQEKGGRAGLSRTRERSRAGRWSWTLKNPGEIKCREVELDYQENPGEIKSRTVELRSHSRINCLAGDLFTMGDIEDWQRAIISGYISVFTCVFQIIRYIHMLFKIFYLPPLNIYIYI